MLLTILKKDLKRKKTMNVILLIFIILAGTFISSSVNNLISISTALDGFMEKARIGDYLILNNGEEEVDSQIEGILKNSTNVDSYSADKMLSITEKNIQLDNEKEFKSSGMRFLCSDNLKQTKFFDHNDKEISIEDGEVYIPSIDMENNKIKVGDTLVINEGDISKEFVVKGAFKDALLGSGMMGAKRLLISENDYKEFYEKAGLSNITSWSVNTSSLKEFIKEYNQYGLSSIFASDQFMIKVTYIMDMLIAGVLIIVSVCLILISMVILRFTIVFTLQEEYREIGIMKAIGIQNRGIRKIYIVKYFAISLIGVFFGFFLSIPFGNMFLKKVSKNIVMSGNDFNIFINFICSLVIILIVIWFSYSCTRKLNKFSAIDAIRNGSNGERFKRKGWLRLSKCRRVPTVLYMAVNDIISGLKHYGVLIITFTLGIILVIVPVNTINTLESDNLVTMFGLSKTDLYLYNDDVMNRLMVSQDKPYIEDYINGIESNLKANNINASASIEMTMNFNVSLGENNVGSVSMQGIGTKTDQYVYLEGSAPIYNNEIALSTKIADAIDASIGDSVNIKMGEVENEYIITALFQTMNNMGEGIRFNENEELDYKYLSGCYAMQIDFSDDLKKDEKVKVIETVSELYPQFSIYSGHEYMNELMGGMSGQIGGVVDIILLVVISINILVSVLMVKTFITKEKGEIGMLKCIGFNDTSIILWQTIRIGIIMLISTVLGAIISNPISLISSAKVFEFMGASKVEFVIKPLEVYVFYPILIFTLTTFACAVTALQIKKISAQETNNIE